MRHKLLLGMVWAIVLAVSSGGISFAADGVPAKLKMTETVQAQCVLNGQAKGTVQIKAGLEFHPDGIEGDRVFVDLGKGDRLYAPLSATNYREAMAADKSVAGAVAAAKESLAKDAVALEIKIGKLVPVGISSQEKRDASGQAITANTFVASAPASGLREGDWWKGQAFPIGQVTHPNTGEPFDCYTASLDEYHAFKAGKGEIVAQYVAMAKAKGVRPKLDYEEFSKLASGLQLDRALHMSAGLTVAQPDDTTRGNEWGFEVSNEQILRLKAKEARVGWLKELQPVWIKGSEVAGFWLKNREMSVPIQQWLKLLQETTLKFNSNDVTGFRQGVQKLHGDWVSIEATHGT